ncbi:hypothetical protein K4L06_06570 [Lysobacter sp. BMK333-48F3]|uniref:hypothetical protein n=1 Tax=Lysobacter sp. BMK333-48F3 TaxID=2867962 RepID=UPI001C8CBAD1|nr:hypothetical protein [Lysobacter sp. BMK333-48F3]MBX9400971.1 hypothetical protein [Lysobacter sp. BMK333-48F3]
MQRILLLIALAAAGGFVYLHFAAPAREDYRIAEIEQRPIPKAVLIELWRDTALGQCERAPERYKLAPQACRDIVGGRHPACAARAAAGAPELIASKQASRRIARPYLDCVLPYPHCRGIEVRSMEQARQHCRD